MTVYGQWQGVIPKKGLTNPVQGPQILQAGIDEGRQLALLCTPPSPRLRRQGESALRPRSGAWALRPSALRMQQQDTPEASDSASY
jgi:hypothetical protein